ncbi:hypothetical protein NL676_033324 [Syzygium grande]|nr:hypothetical protein NL676_033324 [Syzygium grande]
MVNDNLRVIYVTSCNYLKRTPDFSKCMNLKKLVLKYCGGLEEINSSINQLGRLKYLEISKERRVSFTYVVPQFVYTYSRVPLLLDSIGDLKSLSVLKMENQSDVIELPHSIVKEIEFDNVVGQLENLRRLQVRKCKSLVRLSNLSSLKELRVLSVEYCPQLTEIESQPSSTGDCSSTERPIPDTPMLEKLESFRVYYCASVRKLPAIPNACRVEVNPPKYVRRPESGPVFIEDLANSREDSDMEILSEGELRRPRFYWARLPDPQNSQEEFFEELFSRGDLSPLSLAHLLGSFWSWFIGKIKSRKGEE